MRRIGSVFLLTSLVALTGCPNLVAPTDPNQSVVDVQITASVSRGPAPLSVQFTVAAASPNGGPYSYSWNFADGSTSTMRNLTHAFMEPGLYTVRLSVTDARGETGRESIDIQVQGTGATAEIRTDTTAGPAPLLVRFDGTGSSAPDDDIRDYFWDFGDGTTSRDSDPIHQYTNAGEFTATLRVVTAGGVENSTAVTITVGAGTASLDFGTGSVAGLTIPTTATITTGTIEAWIKPNATGGTFFNAGNGSLVIGVNPEAGLLRVTQSGTENDLTITDIREVWHHIAVTYDSEVGGTVYLDGISIGSFAAVEDSEGMGLPISVGTIQLGPGYSGKLAEVRVWSSLRTSQQIIANLSGRANGLEADLIGYWPINEGRGQALNTPGRGTFGTLGNTVDTESTDPDWSTDAPDID